MSFKIATYLLPALLLLASSPAQALPKQPLSAGTAHVESLKKKGIFSSVKVLPVQRPARSTKEQPMEVICDGQWEGHAMRYHIVERYHLVGDKQGHVVRDQDIFMERIMIGDMKGKATDRKAWLPLAKRYFPADAAKDFEGSKQLNDLAKEGSLELYRDTQFYQGKRWGFLLTTGGKGGNLAVHDLETTRNYYNAAKAETDRKKKQR